MSDALCGPSNPLQQFKQQTQLDRTLQQDRLASRQSPAHGFRSADRNAGLLDPEFEAFQAGVPPSQLPDLQPFHQAPQNYGGPAQTPSWAADFQQMHISSPPPFQQQHMPPQGPSNWAQGFREHMAQTPPRAQTSASSPQQFQQMARFGGMNGFQSNFAPRNMAPSLQAKGKEPVMEQFDDAAFEAAFDQAREDMMEKMKVDEPGTEAALGELERQRESQQAHPSQDAMGEREHGELSGGEAARKDYEEQLRLLDMQNKKRLRMVREEQDAVFGPRSEQEMNTQSASEGKQNNRDADDYNIQLELLEQISKERIAMARQEQFGGIESAETMQDPHQIREETVEEQKEVQERAKDDDDALAATAQELLEKVEHNQSDKFRNSQFLGLMRKLRDREVKVEGDKMVETNNAATATTAETQTQPLNSSPSATAMPPRFDNSEQRPYPLQPNQSVDSRPYDYGIPHEEQDHDAGRNVNVNPQDGQDVVDMLNRPGPVTDDRASYDPEPAERYGDSTNGTSSPYLMTRFPPGMRTVV